MKLFLDTNVLASALATRGLCADLFQAVVKGHRLLTCAAVLAELERVLPRAFLLPPELAREYVALITSIAEMAPPGPPLGLDIPDPDDIPILDAAVAARAELFVTGDKLLLAPKSAGGMPIVAPRQCWERLQTGLPSAGERA